MRTAPRHLALNVNGSVRGFGYYVAYEKIKMDNAKANVFGLFLSADIGDSDKVYLEHEQGKWKDDIDDKA